ncbi:MAG: TFIIB-type zinc ribbon-containing protein [Candidatus Aenigmarchaeota archaeon]|nr:TFIIB-type zinc ribbon-containing protein [Candidatus Aenigmarchaeota archaeon]
MKECPECGSKKLERKLDEVVCKKCGLVLPDSWL